MRATFCILERFFFITIDNLSVVTKKYCHLHSVSELFVNEDTRHDQKIPVRINITTPSLPCAQLGLDIQDEMGRHEVGAVDQTAKTEVGLNKDGCNFAGTFHINRVPGNFHVSTHAHGRQSTIPNFQHVLHELRFGDSLDPGVTRTLPGSFNPVFQLDRSEENAMASHEYILKIVPTIYEDSSGRQTHLFQYTFQYKSYVGVTHGHAVVPAVWFRYDLTPITVKYTQRRAPFYTFITTVCAIVGGAFTVAGIIDSFIFTASEVIKKLEIGKLS